MANPRTLWECLVIMSVLSLENVRVPIAAKVEGAHVNPTSDTVVMAFPVAGEDPVAGDWKSSIWSTDTTTTPDTYEAICLVGPAGTIALAVGVYDVWVRVTDSPEVPAIRVGSLEIV